MSFKDNKDSQDNREKKETITSTFTCSRTFRHLFAPLKLTVELNVDSCCTSQFIARYYCSNLSRKSRRLELVSTITLVLQVN